MAAAAVSSAPPPSDKWGPTKCLGDKTNCLDKTAIAVTEFGDDCHVPSAATKSGDDSFQLKVCHLCLLKLIELHWLSDIVTITR